MLVVVSIVFFVVVVVFVLPPVVASPTGDCGNENYKLCLLLTWLQSW